MYMYIHMCVLYISIHINIELLSLFVTLRFAKCRSLRGFCLGTKVPQVCEHAPIWFMGVDCLSGVEQCVGTLYRAWPIGQVAPLQPSQGDMKDVLETVRWMHLDFANSHTWHYSLEQNLYIVSPARSLSRFLFSDSWGFTNLTRTGIQLYTVVLLCSVTKQPIAG